MQPQTLAHVGEPLRAASAGGGQQVFAEQLVAVFERDEIAAVGLCDRRCRGVEAELELIFEVLVDILQNHEILFRAEVLASGLQKVQIVAERASCQRLGLCGFGGVDLLGCAVGDVDRVDVFDELHDRARVNEIGQPAAEGRREVELAVRKCARAAEAAHRVADRTVDALAHLAGDDRAASVVDVGALVNGQQFQTGVQFFQLVGGEDTCLAAAENHNVKAFSHGDAPSGFYVKFCRNQGNILLFLSFSPPNSIPDEAFSRKP